MQLFANRRRKAGRQVFIDELVASRYFFPLVFGTQSLTGVALLTALRAPAVTILVPIS